MELLSYTLLGIWVCAIPKGLFFSLFYAFLIVATQILWLISSRDVLYSSKYANCVKFAQEINASYASDKNQSNKSVFLWEALKILSVTYYKIFSMYFKLSVHDLLCWPFWCESGLFWTIWCTSICRSHFSLWRNNYTLYLSRQHWEFLTTSQTH